jgi:threonine/homoserine/homoserine lactone efflux protein
VDWVWLAAVLYFLPAAIAVLRPHQSAAAILVLNLLLGWTVLGWIVALIWSFTGAWRQRAALTRRDPRGL